MFERPTSAQLDSARGVRTVCAGGPRDRVSQWGCACVPARKRRMVVRWARASSSGDVCGVSRTRGSPCRPSDVAAYLPHRAKSPCVIGRRPRPCCDALLVLPRWRTLGSRPWHGGFPARPPVWSARCQLPRSGGFISGLQKL